MNDFHKKLIKKNRAAKRDSNKKPPVLSLKSILRSIKAQSSGKPRPWHRTRMLAVTIAVAAWWCRRETPTAKDLSTFPQNQTTIPIIQTTTKKNLGNKAVCRRT